MNTKHTPGPWKVDRRAVILDRPPMQPSGTQWYEQVATVESGKDAGANARLIAAAPTLLAACLDALQAAEDMDMECPNAEGLRDAIAKATGSPV